MATFTPDTRNSSTFAEDSLSATSLVWNDAIFIWNDSAGTWNAPIGYSLDTQNSTNWVDDSTES